ncbi:hypothetical protein ACOMHN_006908 [Nucella lapillus]
MHNMKGNQRPQAAMSQLQSEPPLPSARIRCQTSRIQVGSRSYQSASDALSAYMQQFDSKQPSRVGSGLTSIRDPALDTLIRTSARNGGLSVAHRKCDPANVTGLLTGPEDANGVTLDSMMSVGSPHVPNGIRPALKSPKHSVSFVLPDSADSSLRHSTLSSTFGAPGSSQSHNSPRQHLSSLFDSRLQSSVSSQGITQNSSSDAIGLAHHGTTGVSPSLYSGNVSGDVSGSSFSALNGVVHNGQPALKLIHNRPPLKEKESQLHMRSPRCEKEGSKRAKSEVEVLLTEAPSQSDLNCLSQASAGEGKLRSLLQETGVPESSSTSNDKSALQQEVEEALNRSAQLLEIIKTDVLVSPRCVSDVGSLSTDILLSIDPQNPTAVAGREREGRSRHRYSYHTAVHHPRSLSVGPVMGAAEQRTIHRPGRRRLVDSLESSALDKLAFLDLNDSVSVVSDSGSVLKRLQTGDGGSLSGLTSGSREMNSRSTDGPPSWIQELIPPGPTSRGQGGDVTDSLFSERDTSGGRRAPSWVNGLEQSDIASSVGTQDLQDAAETLVLVKKLHGADTVRKAFEAAIRADDSVASELSYAGPGLNYSDLVSSPAFNKNAQLRYSKPAVKVSRTSSFSSTGSGGGALNVRKEADRSRPPVTKRRIFQDLAGVETTRPKPSSSAAPNLSSSLGAENSASSLLRRKVCDDSVELQRSLDRYLSQGASEREGVGARRGEPVSEIPRCSSMNLGRGDPPSVPSNVTGASSITKDSNFSSKLCLDDPTLTPARQCGVGRITPGAAERERRGFGEDGSGGDLLDGDRPWESMLPAFKAPVYVEDCSPGDIASGKGRPETPTLSGGPQPGSMEALKQMLFRLQCEESSAASTTTPLPAGAASQDGGEPELVQALRDYDFEVEPGGQSLERALVHLGRLKTLVQAGTMMPGQMLASASPEHTPS